MASAPDREAIKRFTRLYRRLPGSERDNPPDLQDILRACDLKPRAVRLRDSPLRCFEEESIPETLIHDYYTAIAMKYAEQRVQLLLADNDFNDTESWPDLVLKLYNLLKTIRRPLEAPTFEDTRLASRALRHQLQHNFNAYLKREFPPAFYTTCNTYYVTQQSSLYTFPRYVTNPSILQLTMDEDIPQLANVFDLPDAFLERYLKKTASNADDDTVMSEVNTTMNVFTAMNALQLAPDWVKLLQQAVQAKQDESLPMGESDVEDEMTPSVLDNQIQWLRNELFPWLAHVLHDPENKTDRENWMDMLRAKVKAEHLLYDAFYESRSKQIFDIITDFPATETVVKDLKYVTEKRQLKHDLQHTLLKALHERLLHQGAFATSILQQYISCIRCVQIIDDSYDMLLAVVECIESYMRTFRRDTAEAVVEIVREAEEYGIQDELVYQFHDWELNPNLEDPERNIDKVDLLKLRAIDTVAMLIALCDPLQTFVDAYQKELGKSLLLCKDYDTFQEKARLEMLKKRFSNDGVMAACDIMIKDIELSKRLDATVHENVKYMNDQFKAVILSKHYWPGGGANDEEDESKTDDNRDMSLWQEIYDSMGQYEAEYRKIKASRTIQWLPSRGSVTIELEFDSKEPEEFTVDPVTAMVISLFQDPDERLTKAEVASAIAIQEPRVLESLEFWCKRDIVRLNADGTFQLAHE